MFSAIFARYWNSKNYINSTTKRLMMYHLTLYYSQSQLFAFTIAGFINRKCNLLILGLHDSGKSTLLSRLKYGRLVQHSPTNHPCKLYIYKQFTAFSINLYQWFWCYKTDMHIDKMDFKLHDLTQIKSAFVVIYT